MTPAFPKPDPDTLAAHWDVVDAREDVRSAFSCMLGFLTPWLTTCLAEPIDKLIQARLRERDLMWKQLIEEMIAQTEEAARR